MCKDDYDVFTWFDKVTSFHEQLLKTKD
jgi:hypothetical protein